MADTINSDDGGDFHPIAEFWPPLPVEELAKLADDIKAHGVHSPIWRHQDGRIIDGRNRWKACLLAGVACPSRTYEGADGVELVAFVLAQNDLRRHLTPDQRAGIAAELAGYAHGGDRSKSPIGDLTQAQAAVALGVSKRSVERATTLKKTAPDLAAKVKAGKLKAGAARKAAEAREPAKPKAAAPKPAPAVKWSPAARKFIDAGNGGWFAHVYTTDPDTFGGLSRPEAVAAWESYAGEQGEAGTTTMSAPRA